MGCWWLEGGDLLPCPHRPAARVRSTRAGFGAFSSRQTFFGPLEQTPPDEPVVEGHGAGSFVALRGIVPDHHSGG